MLNSRNFHLYKNFTVMNTGKVANKPTVFPIMQRANPAFLENLGLGDARATGKKSLGISGIHLY